MSIPKMSTPIMSIPKMNIPIMSTVPKCLFLGEIDGLHGTSTQSCILTYDLCTGEPLRRPKPAQDEWYVIMSCHKSLSCLLGWCFCAGLEVSFHLNAW